jgi:DNA-binding transcriptional LysR family regulator
MASPFHRASLSFDMKITARFGTTVCSLVKAGLGISVIDEFTVAYGAVSGICVIPIVEGGSLDTFAAVRNDTPLSIYAEGLIDCLRSEMQGLVQKK